MMRALAIVAVLLLPGCLDAKTELDPEGDPTVFVPTPTPRTTPTPTGPPPDVSGADDLVDANTRFAMDAFRGLSADAPRENLVISPYSISTALQMLYGGASGTTQRAMVAALRLGNAVDTLDADAAALLANLSRSDPNVTLRIGNSIWIDQTFAPNVDPAFPARVQESYDGELFTRDFTKDATVGDINAWASEKTEGKIPKVIDDISASEIMFLMNAVYFNGTWSVPFNASCTHDAPFRTDAGATVQVDMMCGATKAHTFSENSERTIARLPYGERRFAMYLVMPPAGTQLDTFAARWNGDVEESYSPYVELEMPRLNLATKQLDLKPLLTDLGMGVAFTDNADFTRIAENLAVSRVVHDAVMEVDERGTVAAAVTTIGVETTSLPPPPKHLVFDRPFLVLLRDDATGTILFMAKVHDPTAT